MLTFHFFKNTGSWKMPVVIDTPTYFCS